MASGTGGVHNRLLRVIEIAENLIHVLVGVLLAALAIALLGQAVYEAVRAFQGHLSALEILLSVLDKTLVLFIVAELLHTVQISIKGGGALDAEPFLVVGLVAAVRKVLILTAQPEESFHWNPRGIELCILLGLILALAISVVLWRRSAVR
jgi:uncharacterized membrane protein (DUF373 family)